MLQEKIKQFYYALFVDDYIMLPTTLGNLSNLLSHPDESTCVA